MQAAVRIQREEINQLRKQIDHLNSTVAFYRNAMRSARDRAMSLKSQLREANNEIKRLEELLSVQNQKTENGVSEE